jgi:hypothetical protein
VEVREVKRRYEADYLLGLSLTLTLGIPMKIDLWVSRNSIVNNDIEVLKGNTTSSDIC